jgi:hypothetical protein
LMSGDFRRAFESQRNCLRSSRLHEEGHSILHGSVFELLAFD